MHIYTIHAQCTWYSHIRAQGTLTIRCIYTDYRRYRTYTYVDNSRLYNNNMFISDDTYRDNSLVHDNITTNHPTIVIFKSFLHNIIL